MDVTTIINILKSLFAFLRELFIGGHFDTGGRYKLLKSCIIFIFLFSILINVFLIKISLNMSKEIIDLRKLQKQKNEATICKNTIIHSSDNEKVNKTKAIKKNKESKIIDNKLRELENE